MATKPHEKDTHKTKIPLGGKASGKLETTQRQTES